MTKRKILQDDDNFFVEVINWRGKPAVKKSVTPTTRPERVERLKNEAYGLKFFTDLVSNHPEVNLYVPKLYEANDDFIVTEYIDYPAVGDDKNNLDKLAQLLAKIDRVEPYGKARITPSFYYRDIRNRFPVWVVDARGSSKKRIITKAQEKKVNKILDELQPYLTPRIAHGDLSPYFHAFMMPKGKIAFVDFEVFTPNGARYYDVARCYTRLYQDAPSTDIAKKFLSDFMKYADKVEHRDEQLLAIIIQRTVGMQRDADVDRQKHRDYTDRAAELLDLTLKADLKLLLN